MKVKTVTVITYGGVPTLYTTKDLQHMIDDPDLYYCADNLPKWLAIMFMTTKNLPTFECAYSEAIKAIQAAIDSKFSVTFNVRSDHPYRKDKN